MLLISSSPIPTNANHYVTLMLGQLGGGARRWSNGKCWVKRGLGLGGLGKSPGRCARGYDPPSAASKLRFAIPAADAYPRVVPCEAMHP